MPDDGHLSLVNPDPSQPARAEEIRRFAQQLGHIAADLDGQARRFSQALENVDRDWSGPRATFWLLGARFSERRLRSYAQAVEDCAHELESYARLLDGPVFRPPVYFQADSSEGIAPGGCYPDQDWSIESETIRIAERISQLASEFHLWGPICIPPVVWPQGPVALPAGGAEAGVRAAEDMAYRTSAAHRIVGSLSPAHA